MEGAVERKVMKVAVEEFPLRSAPIPPCRISSLAVAKGIDDSCVAIFIGTDTGYLLAFDWKQAFPSTPSNSAPRIRPLRNSPSRNLQASTPTRHSPSPSREELSRPPSSGSDADSIDSKNMLSSVDSRNLSDFKNVPSSPERQKTELTLLTQKCLGRAPIDSLCILKNIGQIAALLDNQVVMVDSSSLALLGKLPNCRGVSTIARGIYFESKTNANIPDERAHLAVAMKNRIMLFEIMSWQQEKENRASGGTNLTVLKEITGIDNPQALVWIKNSVFIATSLQCVVFFLLEGRATRMFSFPVESPWKPLLKAFPKEEELLLVMDIAGILVNALGNPVGGSLVFSGIPDAVGQSSPYALVVNKGVVELFHTRTGSKVQTLAYGNSASGPCLVEDDNENVVVIAKGDKVSCLIHISIEDQLKELLKQKQYNEAVNLAKGDEYGINGEECSVKTRLSMVHAEAGFLLISDLRFEDAVNHLLQSDIVEPMELFPFFPSLTSRWRTMVPRKRYWGLHPPPQPIRTVIENGLFSLVSLTKDPLIGDTPSRSMLSNQYILKASQNFARYWEITRRKDLSSQVKEAIDTVLMKLYIELGFSKQLEELVSSSNFCLLDEVECLLRDSGNFHALALLYESKNMLESALQVWEYLASSGDRVATLEAARVLETCPDSNIVLHHILWIIDMDEETGLRVLTSSKRKELLPADEVLAALKPGCTLIRQRYLQWLIEDQGSEDPNIHTELGISLAKSALRTEDSRASFQMFLESSNRCDAGAILSFIRGTNLWREQAILHMKQGDEALALEILAIKLQDSDAAEKYCAELGRPDAYIQLLQIYLGNEENIHHVIRLLNKHGPGLDPIQVLEALPSSIPLPVAYQSLVRMLRARVHDHRHGQIAKYLMKGVNLEARVAKLSEKSRNIQITVESICSSCNARIGTRPFVIYPNNSIVCFKCLKHRELTPGVLV